MYIKHVLNPLLNGYGFEPAADLQAIWVQKSLDATDAYERAKWAMRHCLRSTRRSFNGKPKRRGTTSRTL